MSDFSIWNWTQPTFQFARVTFAIRMVYNDPAARGILDAWRGTEKRREGRDGARRALP